jgi:NADPH-dependent glutamate synthase beta subunit-like oxidoreductase
MRNSGCKFCGGCVEVCPSGALIDKRKLSDAGFETAPPCKSSCPAGIDIPRYVRLIAEERFQDAIEVVRETVPFPETLGTVCEHPCEQACFRADLNEPISICFLKRFVAEQDDHSWLKRMKILPDTGKKVAVVGSGPAGLTVAWNLRRLGHQVTVFECESQAGGMLRMGIPRYRLPASVLDREISEIQQIGVDLRLNTRIENLDALKSEGYDAIFVSTGAPRGLSLGIPGEDHPRVLEGIGWLRGVAFDRSEHLHGHVGIVGGGNVAIDVARTALRMGAEKVTVFYRRTGDEMPAAEEEVSQALVEGVEFSFLVAPKQAKADGESVALELVKMELGEADASGRRRPVPVEGSEHDVKLDYLFAAIGQRPSVPKEYNLDLTKKNTIAVEKPSFCAAEGIFAGGDVVSGPASAISAISQGRRAAAHIDSYLGGAGIIDQVYVNKEKESERIGREGGFVDKVRAHIEHLPKEKRLNNFDQVDFVFSKEQAVEEAKRCLRCQLRYEIKEAPMPPAGCSGSCSMKR